MSSPNAHGQVVNHLATLRARASLPAAMATDCCAFGQLLSRHAGGDRNHQQEALAALIRAYQLDPACEPTLLSTRLKR
jgi:hypothetical protein